MSKVDALKALREARYAALEAQASAQRQGAAVRAATPGTTPSSAAAPAAPTRVTPAAVAATTTAPAAPAKPTARKRAPSAQRAAVDPAATAGVESTTLCGHRSMGNKSCARPAGHAEKSHRYK